MKINADLIKQYNPCEGGLNNFMDIYGTKKSITIRQLIKQKKISYLDKIWLLKRMVDTETLVVWAIDSSFRADPYSASADAAYAAYAAASYAADAAAATYAANAATYAANAATYAADAAASYAANAAYAAASYAANAAAAKKESLYVLLYLIEGGL